MLPGFRFLFATVVLAVSVLVFGLGAAALLRAAHEEFASLPSWRLAQPPPLAPQPELRAPTLAMLRIEAPVRKSMLETINPQQAPLPEAMRLDPLREVPDTKPIEIARPDAAATPSDDSVIAHTEPSPPASAPAAETVASLNAQASVDAPAAAGTPVEEARSGANPAETNSAETNGIESIQPETKQPEAKQTAATSVTEASEPPASESIASLVRSSEATAADTLPKPKPVVKKTNRPSAHAIARRRLAIARARAARERSRVLLQQQGHNPDPFTQIFSGGNARPG